jgi:hypothetical protein
LGHDKDPYKVASSSHGKISANKARVLTPERKGFTPDKSHERKEIRCTRCWHKGHRWAMCRVTKCSVCGNPFPADAKYCPKWESHTEPGTKWIHPSFHKQQDGQKSVTPGNPVATDEDPQMVAARKALKQARKFLKATVREAKKKKP